MKYFPISTSGVYQHELNLTNEKDWHGHFFISSKHQVHLFSGQRIGSD